MKLNNSIFFDDNKTLLETNRYFFNLLLNDTIIIFEPNSDELLTFNEFFSSRMGNLITTIFYNNNMTHNDRSSQSYNVKS